MSRTPSFTDSDGQRAIKLAVEAKKAGLAVSEVVIGVKHCRILLKDGLDALKETNKNREPKQWPSE